MYSHPQNIIVNIRFLIARLVIVAVLVSGILTTICAQKSTISSGNFSNPQIWSPFGVPGIIDAVVIKTGHTVELDSNITSGTLTINQGGILNIRNTKKLNVKGSITINGTLNIDEGNIELSQAASPFTMGANAMLTWSPEDNTVNGATLFTNGIESFDSTSSLVIEKWYNYSNTPLGSVVTGNFGNISINTNYNGLIYEWDQQNFFEQHRIMGKLTIRQAWVVLDKSGKISNTQIGSIHLENTNSYLDFHSGNHPGTIYVGTESISNVGGTLNGIHNGNGNVVLNVTKDFSNQGSVCLIYNSGVNLTSNGDATLKVSGKYSQMHGDFRGIFNITTTNSGKSDIEFGEAVISGGIFMVQYGCHVAAQTSKLKVKGNLNLNYTGQNGKFRGSGLSTLSGVQNNMKFQLTVLGDLTVNGPSTTEVISSASKGTESTSISGMSYIKGGNTFFNYGAHATEILFQKSLVIEGGYLSFSKTAGTLSVTINHHLEIKNGLLSIKNSTGSANLNIIGDYSQSGGTITFHDNTSEKATDIIYVTVFGNFINDSGNIIFENNSQSSINHKLSLSGVSCRFGGTASINSAVVSSVSVFGCIYYDYPGEMQYHSTGNASRIQNVKQFVSSGCTLKVQSGNLQVASSAASNDDLLTVMNRGILDVGTNQVSSNEIASYSGVKVDDNGKIRTAHPEGLYNGTTNASISAAGNLKYSLHTNSIIEYYGSNEQLITGIGSGTAQSESQQYGILEINKSNSKSKLKSSNVFIRNSLTLTQGELDLNQFNLFILSGKPSAISRTQGYIKSEAANLTTAGQVKWKNIEAGYHTIPFGMSSQKYIPLSFVPIAGSGSEFSASTKQSAMDNRPLPSGISNLDLSGKDQGIDQLIDRYFYIHAPNVIANVTYSYLPEENTTGQNYAYQNFSCMTWGDNEWTLTGGTGTGTTSQVGKVTINNTSKWGYVTLISNELPLWADILTFTAKLKEKQVNVKWVSNANIEADKYFLERSADNTNFETIHERITVPHNSSTQDFNFIDYNPLPGTSYYRLKQTEMSGVEKYSHVEIITSAPQNQETVSIISVGPNPFTNEFIVNYNVTESNHVNIKITALNGQVIYENKIWADEGVNKFHFQSDRQLTSGIYLLHISDERKTTTFKLFNISKK